MTATKEKNKLVTGNHKRKASPMYLDEEYTNSIRRKNNRKRIVFGWYGGKFSHLDWLLPLLPKCHHYCEPFAGSAAVLLNKYLSPIETYNDIDGEVVNFFRVLRDSTNELIKNIALTPFSREEYFFSIENKKDEALSSVEKARIFYIRARQTRTALAQTASIGRWANCKQTSRSGMSGAVSRWLGGVDALEDIAHRLLRVQIENRPAIDIIKLYDNRETLFYCDPPYLHATRGDSKAYGFEMTENEHEELAAVLNNCQGMVAISGYDHELMDKFFKSPKWYKVFGPEKTIHSTKDKRREVLWLNYNPEKIGRLI